MINTSRKTKQDQANSTKKHKATVKKIKAGTIIIANKPNSLHSNQDQLTTSSNIKQELKNAITIIIN